MGKPVLGFLVVVGEEGSFHVKGQAYLVAHGAVE